LLTRLLGAAAVACHGAGLAGVTIGGGTLFGVASDSAAGMFSSPAEGRSLGVAGAAVATGEVTPRRTANPSARARVGPVCMHGMVEA
jgi:hypothetical protein